MRAIVASDPVATVTVSDADPDEACGMVIDGVIPPVTGSVAVVDALVESATLCVFVAAAGDGSGAVVGVAVAPGVGVAFVAGMLLLPPPPHPASASAMQAATAAYRPVLCIGSLP